MNLLEKKSIRVLLNGLMFVLFTSFLIRALLIGGRWDLNEQIAFGYRLISGTASYSNGINDMFFPTSPYFPGVGYLSYFYMFIGPNNIYINNQLMLITAVFVGFLYFILLQKLTIKLYPRIPNNLVYFVLIILYATHFRAYMNYMIEFKPDTILLVFAIIAFFLLENIKKPNIKNLILIGLILFVTTFFKQSFFLLYFYIFLLIFLNKYFSIKEKIIISITYVLIGTIALFFIFNISNLYYFSVHIMGQHPMMDLSSVIHFIINSIVQNIFFLITLLLFVVKRYNSFSIDSLESKYFIFALFWFFFSAISTAKVGGNTGNFEVGVIVFMPFVIYTIDNLLKRFYPQKIFAAVTYVVLFLGTLSYSYLSLNYCKGLIGKIKEDKAAIEFLSNNFNNKNAFIDGNTYIVAEMANLEVLTELETLAHFNNVPEYDFASLKNAIRLKKYDIFLLSQPKYDSFFLFADKNVREEIVENYEVYENPDIPESLKSKILVPKKDK